MNLKEQEIDVKDIDHLGIIAGIMDEMDLVGLIDQLIPPHSLEKISVGIAVKAMVLNCMGFLTSPFYLFSQFFEGKAVEHLLGEGIKAEHLNESRLGRTLDEIFKYGVSQLFVQIVMVAVKVFGVEITSGHADTTSLSVEGEYKDGVLREAEEEEGEEGEKGEKGDKAEEDDGLKPIKVKEGYSRDHRPDLKQIMMGLVTNGAEGIPLMMAVRDGNEADGKHLHWIMKQFIKLWDGNQMNFFVMDSAGYTPDNVKTDWGMMNWIVRVPATIKEAKKWLQGSKEQEFVEDQNDKRYKLLSVTSDYLGITQRWFIVQSEPRRKEDLKKLERDIAKEKERKLKEFAQATKKGFACEEDASAAVNQFKKKLKFHEVKALETIEKPFYSHPGRPKAGEEPQGYYYYPQITLEQSEALILPYKNQTGRFILATNHLDPEMLSPFQALSFYKEQQGTERGFRFIKDPLFFASSVFLKSTSRIMALAFIMALSLLVYSLGQRKLRMALQQAEASVPNQKREADCSTDFTMDFSGFSIDSCSLDRWGQVFD
uniref:IS1634 family transposase n=1 Tax=Prochlorothrix hollandica TaxID=1223 RepID=UPI00034C0F2A|nr:IS1634 family transposase [Prochlorothrix hollandica]